MADTNYNADFDSEPNNADKIDETDDITENFHMPSKKTLLFSSIILIVVSIIAAGLSAAISDFYFLRLVLLIVATASASAAMCLKRSKLMLASAPIAYILALVLTRNPIAALYALMFFPAALLCSNAFSKARTRVSAICRVSAALIVSEVIIFAVSFIATYGSISVALLKEWFNGYFGSLTQTLIDILNSSEEFAQLFSEEQIRSYITLTLIVSPAMVIAAYTIVAFLIQKLTLAVLKLHYNDKLLFEAAETFTMSKASAVIYIIAYILSMIFGGGDGISALSAVCTNLIIILLPGLFFFGIKTFFKRLKKKLSAKASFLLFGMILLLVLFPALILIVASFYGAWATFSSEYAD